MKSGVIYAAFIILFTLYIISNFLCMDTILRLNRDTDHLNEDYQGYLEEHYILKCENSHFKSREYISNLAEHELGLELPKDFSNFAFYEYENEEEDVMLIQYLIPTAEAFSFKIPSRLQE